MVQSWMCCLWWKELLYVSVMMMDDRNCNYMMIIWWLWWWGRHRCHTCEMMQLQRWNLTIDAVAFRVFDVFGSHVVAKASKNPLNIQYWNHSKSTICTANPLWFPCREAILQSLNGTRAPWQRKYLPSPGPHLLRVFQFAGAMERVVPHLGHQSQGPETSGWTMNPLLKPCLIQPHKLVTYYWMAIPAGQRLPSCHEAYHI